MILVTVGAQMPFDRLIQAVEVWAKDHPSEEVFAQIGPDGWRPQHLPFVEFLDPLEFRKKVELATLVISHAGMGTILTALERGKPLLIMPRRGDLHETRNDHQIATARQLAALGRATVAYDAKELIACIDRMSNVSTPPRISDHASPELLGALRAFVLGHEAPASPDANPGDSAAAIEQNGVIAPVSKANGHANETGFRFRSGGGASRLAADRIGSVVVLAAGTGSALLSQAAERSILELPVTPTQTLLSLLRGQLESAFSRRGTDEPVEVRVLGGPLIRQDAAAPKSILSIEHDHDPAELRGTGGLLHDVAVDYPNDSYLVVTSASTLLLEPLGALIQELREANRDVAFFVLDDGSSPNLMLIRARCLRSISPIGYVDFKEQALPKIATTHSIAAVRRESPVAAMARTPADYIRALRQYHLRHPSSEEEAGCGSRLSGPFSETWRRAFAIVESGAEVEADAKIKDSVVLNRAQVGRGALVVRSIICPGAHVAAHTRVVDQIVRPQNAKAIARSIGVNR